MTRKYIVTGSASGIGASTVSLLRERDAIFFGVDIHGADVNAY